MKTSDKIAAIRQTPFSRYLVRFWNWLVVSPVSAMLCSFVISGILIAILGYNPFVTYGYLLVGAFGGLDKLVSSLALMTPVLFCALSHMLGARVGVSNLGMEGQFLGGAMTAALVALVCPPSVGRLGMIVICLLSGAVMGGLIGAVPAIIKRRLGGNEMLISLMMNYVVDLFTLYLLHNVVQNPDNITPATAPIPDGAKLTQLVPGTQLTTGFLLALVISGLLWVFLYKTVSGYKVRAIGINPSVARYKGMNEQRTMMWVFIAAGAIAGVGGAVQIQGVHYCFIQGMSPGYGWDGISAALLGSCEPVGAILGAFVFGALRSGSMYLGRMYSVPSDFIYMLEGVTMLFIAAPALLRKLKIAQKKA